MRPQVFILSGVYDFSTDLVVLRLRELGVPYVRVNREDFKEYRFAMDPIAQILHVRGAGIGAEIGPELVSVWFRQPVFLRNTPAKALLPEEQLERSQWSAFLRAMSVFDNAAWMNFPQATYLAECKPYQLLAAYRCGFQVPRTIVGNDADRIQENFSEQVVIKSLDTVLLRDGDDCLFTYTGFQESKELEEASAYAAPFLAQEPFLEKTDLRVTIVGNTLFPVQIVSGGKGIAGDWRLWPKEELEYRDFCLSPDAELSCRKLANHLNLSFAAVDLVDTPKGIFFIEVNPTGEWGWISNKNRPIDSSIAGWLANPASERKK